MTHLRQNCILAVTRNLRQPESARMLSTLEGSHSGSVRRDDRSESGETEVLFHTSSVYVVKEGDVAVKRHVIFTRLDLDDDDMGSLEQAHKTIENEKRIYRHLGPYDGIVEFCDDYPEEPTIRTRYVSPGDLRIYLQGHEIDQMTQLRWCKKMAETVDYVHRKSVLIQDLRTPNWVVTEQGSVKLLDFGWSEIWPSDIPLQEVHLLYTVKVELAMLGAIFYEVVTRSDPDYYESYPDKMIEGQPKVYLPPLDTLPSLEGVFLGDIIKKLWSEQFESTAELLEALKSIEISLGAEIH